MKRIALIVNPDGSFEVREMGEYGGQRLVAWSTDLADCLKIAADNLGYPLVMSLSGPLTGDAGSHWEMKPLLSSG